MLPRRFFICTINGFIRDFMKKLSLSHLTFGIDLKRRLLREAVSNGDLARLHGLRHFTLQRDRENTIHQRGILDPDVIRELEAALKCAPGDAAMQVLAVFRFVLLPFHQKDVPLLRYFEVGLGETGNRHLNAIVIFARLDDVIGRPRIDRLQPLRIVQQIEDTVEADAGPVKGSKVKFVSHSHILRKATWGGDASQTDVSTRAAGPLLRCRRT
ncbi:hypothetical protein RHECNPAF_12210036 [Rhizobium etli CNPAF512]|nr:hypothetical protein RHECNPAF_12210036 [Rhizobium etli CNPAF512]